ncbi:MAG: hypothetical protein ABIJ96_04835 [Elusimicrobiota bacterium]
MPKTAITGLLSGLLILFNAAGAFAAEKIGLFYGSFDPLHIGHVRMAELTKDALGLDKVYFLPNIKPAHKPDITPFPFRYRMIELAGMRRPFIVLLSMDDMLRLTWDEHEKTYETKRLTAHIEGLHPDAELYHIMGSDSFIRLAEPEKLLQRRRSHLAVVARPGYDLPQEKLEQYGKHPRVHVVRGELPLLSSTRIRNMLAAGEIPGELLPPGVLGYILRHALYGSEPESDAQMRAALDSAQFETVRIAAPVKPETAAAAKQIKWDRRLNAASGPHSLTRHSIGDLDAYLIKGLGQPLWRLLTRTNIPIELHYGPEDVMTAHLQQRGNAQLTVLRPRRHYVVNHTVLAGEPAQLAALGNVYGEERFLHTQLLLRFALRRNLIEPDRVTIYRHDPEGGDWARRYYERALTALPDIPYYAVVMGYQNSFMWELTKRKILQAKLKTPGLPTAADVQAHEKDFPPSYYRQDNPDKAGRYFPDRHLACMVFTLKTKNGGRINILTLRNLWGDSAAVATEILYKKLMLRRFIVFGSAGGLDPELNIGDIVVPERFHEADGRPVPRRPGNGFRTFSEKPRDPAIRAVGRHARVYSPLVETPEYMTKARAEHFASVDVEAPLIIKTLADLRDPSVEAATLLVITDKPGTADTLEDQQRNEQKSWRAQGLGTDLILEYLQAAEIE